MKLIVGQELGFVDTLSTTTSKVKSRTAYLFVQEKHVVGLVLVEAIDKAYPVLPPRQQVKSSGGCSTSETQVSIEHSTKSVKAKLGIVQLWVHARFRRQGIATRLITAARERFVFGWIIPQNQIAFSSPTAGGLCFARKYQQVKDIKNESATVLVYDCGR